MTEHDIIEQLELGQRKIVENGLLQTDLKDAILQQFKNQPKLCENFTWVDKLEWRQAQQDQNFRMCPGAWVRRGAHIGAGAILMPCFVNIGAYVGEKTMIDSNASVGSCAQIGARCHVSSNVVIGGVLEPINQMPVVIEDDCFIGAGAVIAEGVHIGAGAVIGAGCVITASTRIYDRASGEYSFGKIEAGCVVVPGSYNARVDAGGARGCGCAAVGDGGCVNGCACAACGCGCAGGRVGAGSARVVHAADCTYASTTCNQITLQIQCVVVIKNKQNLNPKLSINQILRA